MAAPRTAPRRPTPDRILKATLALAAGRSWREISLAEIAAEAKITLGQLYEVFPSRAAILNSLVERTDKAVLAGLDDASGEPVRERLFDVLMRRFDALGGDKAAVGSILRGTGPAAALCGAPRLLRSMAWSLEAAGIRSVGPAGRMRTKALAAIYLSTMLVWLRDDSPDLGRTMAHLDRSLRRAEWLATRCAGLPRPTEAAQAAS